MKAEVRCHRVILQSAVGTYFFVFVDSADALFAESVAAGEQDVGVVVRRQEQLEADWARIAHHLVVEALFSVELAWFELLGWLWQLLLVPFF